VARCRRAHQAFTRVEHEAVSGRELLAVAVGDVGVVMAQVVEQTYVRDQEASHDHANANPNPEINLPRHDEFLDSDAVKRHRRDNLSPSAQPDKME
jgi:hypothetical protein